MDEDKKDIASQYAYRTLWAMMRVPVFLRAPIAFLAIGCLAAKMVEHTMQHVQQQQSRAQMQPTSSDPFAGAFNDE